MVLFIFVPLTFKTSFFCAFIVQKLIDRIHVHISCRAIYFFSLSQL